MDPLALLRLQIEWGADEALSDDPVDRLASTSARPGHSVPSGAGTAAPAILADGARAASSAAPRLPPAAAADRAAGLAAGAQSLAELRSIIAAFDGCSLRDTASNPVLVEGHPEAGLLLVGEPPGADEDRSGHPFAGAEGALLDKMLASIGLERSSLLLAPLIPWRPPGGRPPNAGELAICLPFLTRVVELTAPAQVVLFGTLTARTLLPGRKRGQSWGELTGRWGTAPALALPGLGALRKDPARRKDAWAGLRQLRRALDAAENGR